VSATVSIATVNFAMREVRGFDDFARHTRELIDAAGTVDVVVFPELFTFELFTALPNWRERPLTDLPLVDEHTDAYRDLFITEARRRGIHIAGGSHLMSEQGSLLNVAHLFAPDGTVHAHAKTHIFPAESQWGTGEGDELVAIDLPFARVGLIVCYEAEVPEVAASLAEQGAELILCPSFTTTEAGFWRVRHCAQARCIENQVYFVHSCTGGDPGAPLAPGWAQASILSPCDAEWPATGVLADTRPNEEMVATAEVDLDVLRQNRETGAAPTFRDRRRRSSLYLDWPSHLGSPTASRGGVSS
jgi:predicted amidohydrolase